MDPGRAIYFGTFDAGGNRAMMDRVEQYYGPEAKDDWWGGVRHARDGRPRAVGHWPGEDFSHLKPSIGYYDGSKPETLERQIAQAAGAGLDHFAFYWYWNPAAAGFQYAAVLRAFLAALNRADLKFTVLPCIPPWRGGAGGTLRMPADQIGRAAEILVDDYLSQPNVLRANDGRPVLQLCDVRGIGKPNDGTEDNQGDDAAVRQFSDTVRAHARERLGEEVLIMMTTDNGVPRPQQGLDGSYRPGRWDHATGSYENYVAGERRWCEDQSPAAFRWLLGDLRADVEASTRPSTVDNFVLLYAWNEWHEGGVIEPNERDGCTYLDIVREELRLRNGAGCVAVP